MTIKSSDSSVTAVRSLLKFHRNEEPLENVFSLSESANEDSISDEDFLLSCSKEENRKLRAIYQDLFGRAKSSNKIKQAVHKFFQKVTFSDLEK